MAEVTSPLLLDNTGQSMLTKLEGIRAALAAEVTIATTSTAGIVKPDGTSISVGNDGTISTSKTLIGLGNVDNTSDASKPISTATQNALNNKAGKATYVQVTIAASGWNSTTSVYSFESQYPASSYDITDVLPNENTTDAQREAWIAADCGGYRSTNTIKAHGTVPTIDIIVELVVVPK